MIEDKSLHHGVPAIPPRTSRDGSIDHEKSAVEAIGCHKDKPAYLERVFGAAAKERRRINAEAMRELDEEQN